MKAQPFRSVEGPAAARKRKVREVLAKRIRRNETPYTWSIGYNNCVGMVSQGKRSRFSGSSLNRKKTQQLKLDFNDPEKNLQAATDYIIEMAAKAAKKIAQRYGRIPSGIIAAYLGESVADKEKFALWLSQQVPRDVFGMGVPVHMLSDRSRGKIKDKATAFFRSCAGTRVFATLTFIAPVDDRTGVAVLNKFLVSLRKQFKDLQFLWVAERQDNGNIHFHIILNKRLPIGKWNAMWVLQQYNAGLVGQNKYGLEIPKDKIVEAYRQDAKEGFRKKRIQEMLNPFDVKKVKSIGGLSGYLTKYITSQKKEVPFGCAVWHCSRRVSRLFTRTTVGPSAFAYMNSFRNYKVDKKTGECWKPEVIVGAYFVMVYAHDKSAPLKYLKEMEAINRWILQGHVLDRLPEIDDELYQSKFKSELYDS
jgi:hypothetical protein